ncbi:MAG: MFS transporter [Calditrichaeota bacterium]|nr:MAG: MFS transporter [Calditrichota bacterium]MBL1203852.1 MFS transporter [Calditrichota bacterium]NOG43684.1 MFS transporter [Calditrichota bacterium]
MLNNIFAHYKSSFSGLSKNAWILTFAMLINRTGTMVIFFLMLYLTKDLNYALEDAGLVISFYGMGAMVGAFAGGWFSDKFGTKFVQLFSLFVGGLGYIVLSYVEGKVYLSISLFFLAIIAESFRPAVMTAIALSCKPENRARGFALIRLAINLGVSIGPAVGGFLALYDYSYIFWFEGLTCIAASFFLLFFYHEPKLDHHKEPGKAEIKKISPFKDVIFIQLLVIMIFTGFVFNQLFNTWPLFIKEFYNFNEDTIGLLLAFNAFVIVLFEMPLVHKFERLNNIAVIGVGLLLLCFGFGAIMFYSSITYIVFTILIWTTGEMLAFPFITSFIANRANDQNRGSYMGMFTFSFSLSFVIGPLLGSWMYKNLGPEFLWWLIMAIGIVVIPGLFIIDKMIKKENFEKIETMAD